MTHPPIKSIDDLLSSLYEYGWRVGAGLPASELDLNQDKAKQALYQRLANEAVRAKTFNETNPEYEKVVTISKLKELMGIKE